MGERVRGKGNKRGPGPAGATGPWPSHPLGLAPVTALSSLFHDGLPSAPPPPPPPRSRPQTCLFSPL